MLAVIYMMWKNRRGFNINKMFGKGSRKVQSIKDIKVRFDDVAGMEQAKVEVTEFVDFLKNNRKFKEMGAKIPRGALLTGPPGTGKTMLAQGNCWRVGCPFLLYCWIRICRDVRGVGSSQSQGAVPGCQG
jgi:ATP-dependent Zn protease